MNIISSTFNRELIPTSEGVLWERLKCPVDVVVVNMCDFPSRKLKGGTGGEWATALPLLLLPYSGVFYVPPFSGIGLLSLPPPGQPLPGKACALLIAAQCCSVPGSLSPSDSAAALPRASPLTLTSHRLYPVTRKQCLDGEIKVEGAEFATCYQGRHFLV